MDDVSFSLKGLILREWLMISRDSDLKSGWFEEGMELEWLDVVESGAIAPHSKR